MPGYAVADRLPVDELPAGTNVLVARAYLYERVAAPDARGIVTVCEHVKSRAHQGLCEVLTRRVDPVTGTASDSPD